MNWQKIFILGAVSTLLSSLACIIYAKVYSEAFLVNFGKVAGTTNFIAASAIGCFLMAVGYKVATNWKGEKAIGWLNLIYSVLSFASIIGVFGFSLPMDIESPEMFPGMVIPMHFFPVLSLLTIYPFFNKNNQN
jgi:hypothetical protein